MKTIDKLIIKAKKSKGVNQLINAFIYPSKTEPGKYVADGRIWNGVPGSGIKQEVSTCISVDAAMKALNSLAEKYPNHKDVLIIINDLKE